MSDVQLRYSATDKVRLFAAMERPMELTIDKMHRIGETVGVEFFIDDAPLDLNLKGTVIGVRHPVAGSAPSLWIEFDPSEKQRAKNRFDLVDGDGKALTLRNADRIQCKVPMTISTPVSTEAQVVDVSEEGCRVNITLPVPLRQTIQSVIHFEEGPLPLFARVCWRQIDPRDTNRSGTGLRFLFQNEAVRNAMTLAVDRLRTKHRMRPTNTLVLMMTEDLATAEALSRVLELQGVSLVRTETGLDTLIEARLLRPTILIVETDRASGVEVCKILRRSPSLSKIPVIAVEKGSLAEHGAMMTLPPPFGLEPINQLLRHTERPLEIAPEFGTSFFCRCQYKSDSMHIETTVIAIRDQLIFVRAPWAEIEGTDGTLTLNAPGRGPLSVASKVVEPVSFEPEQTSPVGFWARLSIKDQQSLVSWLGIEPDSPLPKALCLHPNGSLLAEWVELGHRNNIRVIPLDDLSYLRDVVTSGKPDLILIASDVPQWQATSVLNIIESLPHRTELYYYYGQPENSPQPSRTCQTEQDVSEIFRRFSD